MNDIRISVIVISYNGIEFITDCLTSIVKSLQGESAEIIVVDNGSTDGAFESIKQDLGILKTDVKTIKNDVTKVRRDMTTLFDFLDKDFLDLRQRVDRIEEHLGLPPLS